MSLFQELETILKNFEAKKILIIGDVMIDEYIWGNVTRISPEAPVPVVSCNKKEYRLGGAGNVAINVKSMRAEPVICSVVGKDDMGIAFHNILKEHHLISDGIIESPQRITTTKTRVIGNHQHLLRVDHEITSFLDADLEREMLHVMENLFRLHAFDAVIFQDYDKGVLTGKIIEKAIYLANSSGIPLLVDPKKRSFDKYRMVTLFKPNFKELTEGLNMHFRKNDDQKLVEASKILHQTNQIKNVMITLSEKGIFVSNGKDHKMIPAIQRDIADVSGAGDTVISIAALCLASSLDIFTTAEMSNLAGGIVCEKVGVVPITPELFLIEKKNTDWK